MIPESVLNALTGSIFPGGKGYGALHDVQFIKGAFDAYGSIDPVDKKRCNTHESPLQKK